MFGAVKITDQMQLEAGITDSPELVKLRHKTKWDGLRIKSEDRKRVSRSQFLFRLRPEFGPNFYQYIIFIRPSFALGPGLALVVGLTRSPSFAPATDSAEI